MQQTSSGESIMAQQHPTQDDPPPRVIAADVRYRGGHHQQNRDYLNEQQSGPEIFTNWLWPIASWLAVGFNVILFIMAIWNSRGEYIWSTHYALIIAFVGTLAALSATYKYIIMREK